MPGKRIVNKYVLNSKAVTCLTDKENHDILKKKKTFLALSCKNNHD